MPEVKVSEKTEDVGITRPTLYEASTQHTHWRYSSHSLAFQRSALNSAAVDAIRATFEREDPGSSQAITFLTTDDEILLVKLYVSKIAQLCAHFRLPEVVEATACSYLRRFYMKNTVMDWHPKNVMITVLFLAAKTSNYPIPLDTYASKIPKTTREDVLQLEFLVAQSLSFEFVVWHAYRALWGIYLDIQTLPEFSTQWAEIHAAYMAAIPLIRRARLTDVEFLYSPSQIALSCWHHVSPAQASAWATAKFEASSVAILQTIVQKIQDDGSDVDLEAVREIDKRLRICKNPEKVPGTKAFDHRRAQEEAAAKDKRDRKAASARLLEVAHDPFSSSDVPPERIAEAQRAKQLDEDDF